MLRYRFGGQPPQGAAFFYVLGACYKWSPKQSAPDSVTVPREESFGETNTGSLQSIRLECWAVISKHRFADHLNRWKALLKKSVVELLQAELVSYLLLVISS